MPSILHCAFAAPTPAVSLASLSRVCFLPTIDLANVVEGSIADRRGWLTFLDQFLSHALKVLVLCYDGSKWHFLQVTYLESCRQRCLHPAPICRLVANFFSCFYRHKRWWILNWRQTSENCKSTAYHFGWKGWGPTPIEGQGFWA